MKQKGIWVVVSILVVLGLLLGGFGCAAPTPTPTPSPPKVEVFPAQMIYLISAYAVGGGTDRTARVLAAYADAGGPDVRMQVVNMTGGAGAEANLHVAKAKPGGYTLLAGHTTFLIEMLYREVDWSLADFESVCQFADYQYVIHVRADAPWNTLQEFIDDAKKNPGKFIVGNQGIGTQNHLVFVEVMMAAGIDVKGVPYEGSGPATAALLGGEIDVTTTSEAGALSGIKDGLTKGLAFSDKRVEGYDFGTIAEAGIDIKLKTGWRGIFTTGGTPQDRVETLSNIFGLILESPGTKSMYGKLGETIAFMPHEEFREMVAEQYEALAPIIKSIK